MLLERTELSVGSPGSEAPSLLLTLQWRQFQHDERSHRDILALSVADRLKHMTLHFAKYLGTIAAAYEDRDNDCIHRTLVDAFIIVLASANALGISLERDIPCAASSLIEFGRQAAEQFSRPGDVLQSERWFLSRFARYVGRMSKACESLDHLEDFTFRRTITTNVAELGKLIMAEAASRYIDLPVEVQRRQASIEQKALFAPFFSNTAR